MRRLLALPLAALALLIFAAGPAAAADITVDEANDDTNSNGQCSLREAVQAANSNSAVDGCTAGDPDGDTITFGISAGSLPIVLDGGELLVSDDVEVNGTTATGTRVSIDAQGNSRIFDVNVTDGAFPGDESAVAFQALVLTNGNANTNSSAPNAGGAVDVKADDDVGFTDVDVTSSVAGVNGGGIHAAGGTSLVITTTGDGSSTISGNEAQGGDAASDPVRGGGGVWSAGSTTLRGNVTVDGNTASGDVTGSGGGLLNEGGTLGIEDGVTVSNNTANRAGGGVEDNGGISTTLDGATLTGNEATGDGDAAGNGGGLHSGGGDVRVFDGTVSDNTAVEGGGLWSSGLLTVVDDGMMTVIDNTATGDAASDGGGGIYNHGGDVTISNAEIDGNRATGTSGSGGGILNNGRPGDASLTLGAGVTVSNNAANRAGGGIEDAAANGNVTSVTLNSATVSNNVAGTNPGNGGGLHSGGGNVSINGGTFGGNTAQEGGGLWTDGELSISGTTIDGNAAQGARSDDALGGGGAYVEGGGSLTITGGAQITNNTATGTAGSGGGLLSNASTLAVQNATIGSNQANRAGAGIEDAGGDVTLTDVVLDGNAIDTPAPGNGGGLHSSGGDVTIRRGAVTNNTAQEGGGLWTNGSLDVIASSGNQTEISDNAADGARTDGALGGGGVYVASGGEAVLRRALVTSNTATGTEGSGGGLFVDDSSTVDMTLGAVSSNQANRAGAGIEVGDDPGTDAATTVSLERVTVDDNSIANANPGNGGGLHSGGAGDVSVLRSTFSNNEAAEGGGLWGSGGSKLNIDLSTISGNTATSAGGGVYLIGGGTATLTSTTVAQNTAAAGDAFSGGATPASFTLGNTIVAGDGDGDGLCAEPATYTSDGFNLVEDADCLDSP
jgi:CSLREA domain-containing protein